MVNGYSINSINNKSPLWKQLGYSSEAEWRQATGGGNLAGYTNPTLKPTTPSLPTGPSVQMPNLSNYFNGSVVGVGGSIGKGNGNGGVTDEGVIIGNPSVNNSTFNKTSYGGSSSEKEEQSTTTPTQTKPTVGLEASASGSKPVESEITESGGSATGTGSYSYNNEARFLEWYKRNYGVDYDPAVGLQRPEGMDDGVWAAGNTLYSYYLEEQRDEKQREELLGTRNEYYDEQAENLLANYATAQEALDKSKRNSQQTSSITYDKLKKYLPTQIKAQGLGGLGVSETTMLQAQTNYANEMGEIERAYSEDSANLASNKADDMTNLEKYRQDALDSVNSTYDGIARTREDNARLGASADISKYEGVLSANFEEAWAIISESEYVDEADMTNLVNSFKNKVTGDKFNSLVSLGQSVLTKNQNAEADEVEAENKVQQDKDNDNAYIVAQSTVEGLIADGKYDEARKYLDDNKDIFGESVYNAYITNIQTTKVATTTNTHTTAVDNFLTTNYSSVSASYEAYNKIMSDLESARAEIGEDAYNELVAKMNSTSSKDCSGGWFIQGLGSGRENDDIDITIGSTSRKGNGAKEYDLLCGAEVTDEKIKKALNKLATGDENKSPSTSGEGSGWFFGVGSDPNISSTEKDGKIVVFMNQMYIYTTKGWRVVKADNDASQLQDAIDAFLGK